MSPFFVFSKEIDWPSLQGICYLIWEERSVACTLLQFLQPSLSECSRSSCRLCNDSATVCCCTDQFYPSYNGPCQRYSGHFEFFCFKYLLSHASGEKWYYSVLVYCQIYINSSLRLVQKYPRILVSRHLSVLRSKQFWERVSWIKL